MLLAVRFSSLQHSHHFESPSESPAQAAEQSWTWQLEAAPWAARYAMGVPALPSETLGNPRLAEARNDIAPRKTRLRRDRGSRRATAALLERPPCAALGVHEKTGELTHAGPARLQRVFQEADGGARAGAAEQGFGC